MKPDWNLIKKNFAETGKLIKESAKELLKVIDKETEKPAQTPEERLEEIRKKIKENPGMDQKEIDEMLAGVFNEPGDDMGFEEIKANVLDEWAKLKEKMNGLVDNDVVTKMKEKIDSLIHDKDVEQLREVLNMESSLNDICSATKDFTKSVGERLKNNIKDLFEKKDEETPGGAEPAK